MHFLAPKARSYGFPRLQGGLHVFPSPARAVVMVLYKLAPSKRCKMHPLCCLSATSPPLISKGRLLKVELIYAHHNPQRRSRCQTLEPFEPFEPSAQRAVTPMAKPPGLSSWGFCSSLSLRGKGPGLYPQITVLRLSNHPAWRDEGGVMNEVKPFSGLPWPGVRGGILPPVSFQP